LVVTQPYVGEIVVVAQVLWTVTVTTKKIQGQQMKPILVHDSANTSLNRREECCTQQRTQGASIPHLHEANGGLI
jgi:hypothetical protein